MRETEFGRLAFEIRSVNNRFLEMNVRLGSSFLRLDQKCRAVVRNTLKRGKVDIMLRFDPADTMIPPVRINEALFNSVKSNIRELDAEIPITAGDILSVPGVVVTESADSGNEELDKVVLELLDEALAKLIQSRENEGETLNNDFIQHHRVMAEKNEFVKNCQDEVTVKYRDRLHERIAQLMQKQGAAMDEGRLELEVALFADKADLTEEVNRLTGHLDALDKKLSTKKFESGKGLEFLAQEMLREVNTIGSKCRDLEIARHVIDMKQELESLRENLANVE